MKSLTTIVATAFWALCGLLEKGMAQTGCANYGDPIIRITFGNAESPMTRLPDATTDYIWYQGGGQSMRPNYYTITDNARKAGNIFYDFPDHTGDPGGGMLLVNADYTPGIFYTEVQYDLCPNTDFTFSAWVINASPPDLCDSIGGSFGNTLRPNVSFEILTLSGELIKELPTGEILGETSPRWRYYEVSFNTGDNTDVILVMRNVGPGGCGNNLAIDDIQFRPCGPELELTPSLQIIEDNTIFLCAGADEVTFQGNIGLGYDAPVYQWQERADNGEVWQDMAGANRPLLTVNPSASTWYRLTVAANAASLQNPKCRVVSEAIRVAHAQTPILSLAPESFSRCLDDLPLLEPGDFVWPDTGPLTYQWHEHDGNDWRVIQGVTTSSYMPSANRAGVFRYQRRAINTCGVDFPVNEFMVEVRPSTETSLDLPVDLFCVDSEAILLTGGMPETFDFDGQAGIYSGPGVQDGIFYPSRAGVGQHIISYSPSMGSDCPVSSMASITVIEAVYVAPMADHVILSGESIRLIPTTNATYFSWDASIPGLNDYHTAAPVAAPVATTTYRLTVSDIAGCEQMTTVTVRILEHLVMPNSFTPNGDGINDVWEISGLEYYPNVNVQVFNRWGRLVFSSKGYAAPWDGQFHGDALPMATYYYVITSDILDAPLSGSVTIIR